MRSHSSTLNSSNGESGIKPALLTRTSRRPNRSWACLTKSGDVGPAGHIKLQRLGFATGAGDFGGDDPQPVVAPCAQHDLGALLGKMA
jgi:hypothetical protein